jgi:HSP20 family molecular chaperone IbpA
VRVAKSAAPIKVDVVETETRLRRRRREIPGVSKDDIQVSIEATS